MNINGHEILFDETKHEYTVDGVKRPSVTDICSYITGQHYDSINASVLEYASRRGTAIHEACEIIDLGGEPDLDPEIAPYLQAYMDFLHDYLPDWELIEQIVYDDVRKYCGTVDRFGVVGNEWWVLDIKSTGSPNRGNYMSVCCQTVGYLLPLISRFTDDMVIKRKALYLRKDGTYRLLDCEEWERKNNFEPFELFPQMADLKNKIERTLNNGKQKSKKSNNPD